MNAGSNKSEIDQLMNNLQSITNLYSFSEKYIKLRLFDEQRFSLRYAYKNIPEKVNSMLQENNTEVDSIRISILDDKKLKSVFEDSVSFVITMIISTKKNFNSDFNALKSWSWGIYDNSQKMFDLIKNEITEGIYSSVIKTIQKGVWGSTFYCLIIPFEKRYPEFKKLIEDKSKQSITSVLYRPNHPNILKEMKNLWHDDEFNVYNSAEFIICPYTTDSSRKEEYIEGVTDCLERFAIFLLITEKLQDGCLILTNELSEAINIVLKELNIDQQIETIIKSYKLEEINKKRLSSIRHITQYTRVLATLDDEIMKTSWTSIHRLIYSIKKDLNFTKQNEIITKEINDTQVAVEATFQVFSSQIEYLTTKAINSLQYLFVTLTTVSILIPILFALPLYQQNYDITYIMKSISGIVLTEVVLLLCTYVLINRWKFRIMKKLR